MKMKVKIFLTVPITLCLLHCVICEYGSNYTADHIFRMKYCGLTEVPTNISSETKKVRLSHNKIANIKAGAFLHLTNCTELVLSDNKLVRIRRDMFQGLKSLRRLILGHNQISHIQHGSFARLQLAYLYLPSNRITKLGQCDVFKSRHLKLFLGDNPLQCDWRICWIKQAERDGWITLRMGECSKPHCANFQGIPWDNITGFCSRDNITDFCSMAGGPSNPVEELMKYIIGGVVGLAVCLVIFIGVILFKCLRRRSAERAPEQNVQIRMDTVRRHGAVETSSSQHSEPPSPRYVDNAPNPEENIRQLAAIEQSGYEVPIGHWKRPGTEPVYHVVKDPRDTHA